MERERWWRKSLWLLGGLALGGIASTILGVLVFWLQPTLQRARSPVGEFFSPPFSLRYVKGSPIAADLPAHAEAIRQEWDKILEKTGLRGYPFPKHIYIYLYASLEELPLGINARQEEEATPLAIADVLVPERVRGTLAWLACSLALGPPGNMLFPRGQALCLDEPDHDWLGEAGAWLPYVELKTLWQRAKNLLPRDPWEELYFQVDAPWVGTTPTWETSRTLLQALKEVKERERRMWEVLAAAQAQWVSQSFGARGVRAFWLATSWEKAAEALMLNPEELWESFHEASREAFAKSPHADYFAALRDLHRGLAETAISRLTGLEGEEARQARAQAWLALGESARFCEELGECPPEMRALAQAPRHQMGRWLAIGENTTQADLEEAVESARRILSIWEADESVLPERIVFFVVDTIPNVDAPWNVVWVKGKSFRSEAARLVLKAISPWVNPNFSTLSEGLVLWAAEPSRDFRKEAYLIVAQGHWVPLSQPLFGVYPQSLAEAEAGAFVSFLLQKFGPSEVRALWEVLSQGASIFRASQQVLGLSWYDLEDALLKWIKQP